MQTQTETSSQKKWMDHMPSSMQACIQNCTDCYQVCAHVMEHCLTKGEKYTEPKHIKLLQDCASICNLSADFMIRNSDLHTSTCRTCAEICKACAVSCETFAGDPVMQTCAEVCRKAAASCEEMAKMH